MGSTAWLAGGVRFPSPYLPYPYVQPDRVTSGLFIIDGVITIPIALLGFLIMPDLPTTTKPSIFFTEEQLEIGKRRMEEIGRKPPSHFTKKKVRTSSTLPAYESRQPDAGSRLLHHLAYLHVGSTCVPMPDSMSSIRFSLTYVSCTAVYVLVGII